MKTKLTPGLQAILQTVFDVGVAGILKQGCGGYHWDGDWVFCCNLTPDGNRCVIGQCITPEVHEKYTLGLAQEGKTFSHMAVSTPIVQHALAYSLGLPLALIEAIRFDLAALQNLHDGLAHTDGGAFYVERFREEAAKYAARHGLSTAVIE